MQKVRTLWFCLLIAAFSSCQKEDSLKELSDDTINRWIYSEMKANYLWLDELKNYSSYPSNATPKDYFNALISSNEKKTRSDNVTYWYSYLEETGAITKVSSDRTDQYGFEFILYAKNTGSSSYNVRVLYVVPGSPADRAGLKRGMWILKMNDQEITRSNYPSLKKGNGLSLGVYTGKYDYYMEVQQTLTLSSSQYLTVNPILKDTILEFPTGKVGYLAYVHFSTGPNGFEDKSYEDELIHVFRHFKENDVKYLILDLRYNPGGYLTTSILLASLLVKEEYLTKSADYSNVFCRVKYNPQKTQEVKEYYFDASVKDANLNLSTLAILTGEWTASASEAVINGLQPLSLMDLILIGSKTEGKNLGSETYISNDKQWIMHPIVAQIYNQNDESGYWNGIIPEDANLYNELDFGREFGELGSLTDYPINLAIRRMGLINTVVLNPKLVEPEEEKLNAVKDYCSMSQKATNSVWIK